MTAKYGWTKSEERELIRLAMSGKILNKDIAKKLGRTAMAVNAKLERMGVRNRAIEKKMGRWNCRYSDEFKKSVVEFFKNHTIDECAEKFELSKGQVIGIIQRYRESGFISSNFKDSRNKNTWTSDDYRFLLSHAGLMPRSWIANKLERGSESSIKDRLKRLNISSRSINGLTVSQFCEAFGKNPEFCLSTKAGPKRESINLPTHYKIVPWVWMDEEIKSGRLKTVKPMELLISSMAMFQRWIYGTRALEKMKKICSIDP